MNRPFPFSRILATRRFLSCGQTEFFLTDDDGYSHCFGVPTQR